MSDTFDAAVVGMSGIDQVPAETWDRLIGATADLLAAKAKQIDTRTEGYNGLFKKLAELVDLVIAEVKKEAGLGCCSQGESNCDQAGAQAGAQAANAGAQSPFAEILKNAAKGGIKPGDPLSQLLGMLKGMDGGQIQE